jgi:hypothetical protein
MKISSTAHKITFVLVGLAMVAVLGGVAQGAMSTSRPAGMSKAEYRAMMIRGQALDQKYRIGAWKGVPTGMTPAQYRAMKIRGEALNKRYGLGRWSTIAPRGEVRVPEILSGVLLPAAPAAALASNGNSHGFAWGAFGIGVVAMLGLALLAAGVIGGRRHTRGTPRVRTS